PFRNHVLVYVQEPDLVPEVLGKIGSVIARRGELERFGKRARYWPLDEYREILGCDGPGEYEQRGERRQDHAAAQPAMRVEIIVYSSLPGLHSSKICLVVTESDSPGSDTRLGFHSEPPSSRKSGSVEVIENRRQKTTVDCHLPAAAIWRRTRIVGKFAIPCRHSSIRRA